MARHTHIGRPLVSLVLLSLLLGLVGSAAAVAADSSTYQDPNGAYSFTLPDGWQASSPYSSGFVTFTNMANGTFFLIGTDPADGLSLDDTTQQATSSFAQIPGYEAGPDGVTDVTVGGQPAKGLSFHNTDKDGSPISTGVVLIIKNDTIYELYFITPRDKENASDADVTTILTSWQFTE